MNVAEHKKSVAAGIENRLKQLNISRGEFAELMQAPPSSITKWLSGTHNFTIETLFHIDQKLMEESIKRKLTPEELAFLNQLKDGQ